MNLRFLSALAALIFAATASAQNLIVNGNFETAGAGPPFGVTNGSPNTTLVPSWTAFSSSGTSVVGVGEASSSGLTAVDGTRILSINFGDFPAGVIYIEQAFATTIGTSYLVTFSAGRASSGGGLVGAQVQVFDAVSGGTLLGGATSSSSTAGPTFYAPASFTFTATTTDSRLKLADISTNTGGVDLVADAVSVTAIPEPSAVAALLAVTALGFVIHRRRAR